MDYMQVQVLARGSEESIYKPFFFREKEFAQLVDYRSVSTQKTGLTVCKLKIHKSSPDDRRGTLQL